MHFLEEFREEPAGPAEFRAGFGARGVSGLCVLRAGVAVPGSPLPGSLGHSGAQPHGRAGQQQVLAGSPAVCFSWCPELGLPHVFGSPWQSLGRSVVRRGILHVPVSGPSSSGPRLSLHCSVLAFGCGAVPRVPLSYDPWICSRAWQPREQFGGAGPAGAGPSVPTGTEASP